VAGYRHGNGEAGRGGSPDIGAVVTGAQAMGDCAALSSYPASHIVQNTASIKAAKKRGMLEDRIEQARRIHERNPGFPLVKRCAVCGMPKATKFLLCNACQNDFGTSKDWPKWVRYLVNNYQKELRYEKDHKNDINYYPKNN